jgi:hypothetical protein
VNKYDIYDNYDGNNKSKDLMVCRFVAIIRETRNSSSTLNGKLIENICIRS